MSSTIISESKKSKNIDFFLRSMIDELKQLNTEIDCYDAATKSDFTLRAWVIIAIEDESAVADIMRFKRSENVYKSYHHYFIKKILSLSFRTYYVFHIYYNFERSHLRSNNLRNVIYKLVKADSNEHYK